MLHFNTSLMRQIICFLSAFLFYFGANTQPSSWQPAGMGGGGALFAPSINPHQTDEIYVASDLTAMYHSNNFGESWSVVPFYELTALNESQIQFTSNSDIRYAIHSDFGPDLRKPIKSTDGGQTWQPLASDPTDGDAWTLFADPNSTDRLLLSSYSQLFFSSNGGNSFQQVYTANDFHIAGVFWDGDQIYVGTREGLLVSTNAGQNFSLDNSSGLSANDGMLSFTGAKASGTTRLFCVARAKSDIWPGIPGSDYWSDQQVYGLDYGSGQWTVKESGIPAGDFPFYVAMAKDNIDVVYVAGATAFPQHPMVYKSTNGGNSWTGAFQTNGNANIRTGWAGDGGDLNWGWAENAMGFTVCSSDPNRLIITDFGFAHVSSDGGATWSQAYVDPMDSHAPGNATPQDQAYRSNGLENTSCWWLHWTSEQDILAGYSDITAAVSDDGGNSWSFDYSGNDYNSTYQIVAHPQQSVLYAAVSTVHDLYQSTYLTDNAINGGDGGILFSTNEGQSWSVLNDFGHPVVSMAIDPGNTEIAYASVVHNGNGDIYKTTNLSAGASANWTRLSSPPRTQGHPFQVRVLDDGMVVCTYSGRRASGFTASSGLFVSEDGGTSWDDRSDPGMHYWTKDVVIDPHDSEQNTWYVAVFSGWGGAPNNLGGIYRTTDRGQNWTRINDLDRVESMTIDPINANEMYVTTEYEGLWHTSELNQNNLSFQRLGGYPFQHPVRVFFNPYDASEIWVSSFGNGLRKGNTVPTEISDLLTKKQPVFYLSPNPASNHAILKGEAHFAPGQYHLELVNAAGQRVRQASFLLSMQSAEHPIPLNELAPGQYFVRIKFKGELIQLISLLVHR